MLYSVFEEERSVLLCRLSCDGGGGQLEKWSSFLPTGILKSCPNVACQFRERHLNFNPKCDVVVKVARLTAAVRYAVVLFRYSLMIFTTVASLKYCDMGD